MYDSPTGETLVKSLYSDGSNDLQSGMAYSVSFSGVSPGTYYIEVFYKATGTPRKPITITGASSDIELITLNGNKVTSNSLNGSPILSETVNGFKVYYKTSTPSIPARYIQTTSADFDANGNYIGTNEYIILPADKPSGYRILNINVKGVATNGDYLTDTSHMFNGSPSLYLELDYLDTSNVTLMNNMFTQSQATTLDLSGFDTSNVTNMGFMFGNNQAIILDLSSFDTSNVTNMSGMFGQSKATELDLSSFDTSNVTNMNYMFISSKTTTGYAKTQTDADRFNNSSMKPSTLTFVVK